MKVDQIDRLRLDLVSGEFGTSAIRALLGSAADEARTRGVLEPARRVLGRREPSALVQLVRLLLLGESLSETELAQAFPTLGPAGAIELGLVSVVADEAEAETEGAQFRSAISLNPVSIAALGSAAEEAAAEPEEWFIASDLDDHLRRAPARADHVMGVGGATRSLLLQAPSAHDLRALDLGTGCGVVALALARSGAEHVVATDISERALAFARMNAQLNGLSGRIDFRCGDLFAPVAGERFDLILSNPPFVITPRNAPDVPKYEYRDAGRTGDELARAVVTTAPEYLTTDGTLLCLANWEYPWGEAGLARAAGWIEEATTESGPLCGWVIERDQLDPVRYAETWVRDGGARPGSAEFDALIGSWLEDFEARRVTAIGMGSVRVRRLASGDGVVRAERVQEPFGEAPAEAMEAALRAGLQMSLMSDEVVLETRWTRSRMVTEVRKHRPGQEAPYGISLQTVSPFVRTVDAETVLAAAVGASDGELSLGQISDALASILEVDSSACAETLVDGFRELAWLGVVSAENR